MFFDTVYRIFLFSLKRNVLTKKTILFLLLYACTGGIAYLAFSNFLSSDIDGFTAFISPFLMYLVPVTALFFGISIFAEDIEESTLVYILTKPLSKAGIIAGKYFSFIAISSVMLVAGFISLAISTYACFQYSNFDGYGKLLMLAAGLVLALCAYGGVFVFLALIIKRPLLVGFAFLFGWEELMSRLPVGISGFTIRYYLNSFYSKVETPVASAMANIMPTEYYSPIAAVFIIAAITSAFLSLAVYVFKNKDYSFVLDSY